jgi:2,3-bisphosphoglycerate-independent phosphoglycerate mutase
VAARGNFCTVDSAGRIIDRRAGRISSEQSAPLAARLRQVKIEGVEVYVEPVKEYRFVVVFRGPDLHGDVHDTDPQATGVPPLEPVASDPRSRRMADVAGEFIRQACRLLADQPQANCVTLRGFSPRPDLPGYETVYGLKAGAIAVYPMYKGLARLVGMTILGQPTTLVEQIALLTRHYHDFDFVFLHFKYTDSTGEDGAFDAKVKRIEELDAVIPQITALQPDVLVVTGDHSTPSLLRSHSWHPVPTLLVSKYCRSDACNAFNESECLRGGLGQLEAKYLMPLALANARRLGKYGA